MLNSLFHSFLAYGDSVEVGIMGLGSSSREWSENPLHGSLDTEEQPLTGKARQAHYLQPSHNKLEPYAGVLLESQECRSNKTRQTTKKLCNKSRGYKNLN